LSARLDSAATARLRPAPDATPADDLAHILVEHSGVPASIVIGNANPGVAIHRWTIVGERGNAVLDNPGRDYMAGFALSVSGGAAGVPTGARAPAADGAGRLPPFQRLAARFIDTVRNGGRCRPDFSDAARVARLIDATRQAAQTKQWIDVV